MINKSFIMNIEGGKYRLLLICANLATGDNTIPLIEGEQFLPDTFLMDAPVFTYGFDENIPIGLNLATSASFNIDVNSLYEFDLIDVWEAIRDNGKFDDYNDYPEQFIYDFAKGADLNNVVKFTFPNYWALQENIDGTWTTRDYFIQSSVSDDNKFTYSSDTSKRKINLYSLEKFVLENISPDLCYYTNEDYIYTGTTGQMILLDYFKAVDGGDSHTTYTYYDNINYKLSVVNEEHLMTKFSDMVKMFFKYVSRGTVILDEPLNLPNPLQYIDFYKQGLAGGTERGDKLNKDEVWFPMYLYSSADTEYIKNSLILGAKTAWDLLTRFYEACLMRVSFSSGSGTRFFRTYLENATPLSGGINFGHVLEGGEIEIEDYTKEYGSFKTKTPTLSNKDLGSSTYNVGGSLSKKSISNELFFNNMPTMKETYKHPDWAIRIGETWLRSDRKDQFPFSFIHYLGTYGADVHLTGEYLMKVHYSADYNGSNIGISELKIENCYNQDQFEKAIGAHQTLSLQALLNKKLTDFFTNDKNFIVTVTLDLFAYTQNLILGETYQLDFMDNIPQYSRTEIGKIGVLSSYELDIKNNSAKCTFFMIG